MISKHSLKRFGFAVTMYVFQLFHKNFFYNIGPEQMLAFFPEIWVARRYIFKPNLGKCWRVLQWKILHSAYILLTFSLFYGKLVYFMLIWPILWSFGILYNIFGIFWYIVPRKIWQPCQ
jgi:hypothetical protein